MNAEAKKRQKWKLINKLLNTVRQEKGLPLQPDIFKDYDYNGALITKKED